MDSGPSEDAKPLDAQGSDGVNEESLCPFKVRSVKRERKSQKGLFVSLYHHSRRSGHFRISQRSRESWRLLHYARNVRAAR